MSTAERRQIDWTKMTCERELRPVFKQVAILAPGLLGSSLGMALQGKSLAQRIVVWARRPEVRLACAELPWCDETFATPEDATTGSDLIVLCTPVEVIHRLCRRIVGKLEYGAIVTDVGSTKSLVCRFCDAFMPLHAHFVGSHPMAGSEKGGLENAQADLFEGRPCFVTPLLETDEKATETVVRLWKELNMEVRTLSPEVHDEIVANISHLPHILASALSAHLSEHKEEWRNYAGNGLKDTTRIAAGNPQLWKSIIEQNRDEILRALDGFDNQLHRFRSALANENYMEIVNLLERGKVFRDSLRP